MDFLNKLFKCVSSPQTQIGIRSMVVHVEATKNKHFFHPNLLSIKMLHNEEGSKCFSNYNRSTNSINMKEDNYA